MQPPNNMPTLTEPQKRAYVDAHRSLQTTLTTLIPTNGGPILEAWKSYTATIQTLSTQEMSNAEWGTAAQKAEEAYRVLQTAVNTEAAKHSNAANTAKIIQNAILAHHNTLQPTPSALVIDAMTNLKVKANDYLPDPKTALDTLSETIFNLGYGMRNTLREFTYRAPANPFIVPGNEPIIDEMAPQKEAFCAYHRCITRELDKLQFTDKESELSQATAAYIREAENLALTSFDTPNWQEQAEKLETSHKTFKAIHNSEKENPGIDAVKINLYLRIALRGIENRPDITPHLDAQGEVPLPPAPGAPLHQEPH